LIKITIATNNRIVGASGTAIPSKYNAANTKFNGRKNKNAAQITFATKTTVVIKNPTNTPKNFFILISPFFPYCLYQRKS
jgi:hypothetical protein